jgi:endonuclease/exonuclease/phosphatase family metal-dependent hydrolase
MSFIQVGSWNIEHLSGSSRADRRQSAYALADHIEMSGLDVLALQEVYVTTSDQEVRLFEGAAPIKVAAKTDRRNSDLDIVCHLLEEHLDDPWQYILLPNRNEGDSSQLCGVMWNTNRLRLSEFMALNVLHEEGEDNLWDRKPHVLQFTSEIEVWRREANGEWIDKPLKEKRSFSLIPLHMKSNYGGVTRNRAIRKKEALSLCNAIQQVRAVIDPSIIMIGDTNILNNSEPAIDIFVNNGFRDLNNNDAATYWSPQYSEAPFDRVFVAEDREEFKYSRQYVMRSSDLTAHDRFLSDHYMIKVSVKDYVDDSDPR